MIDDKISDIDSILSCSSDESCDKSLAMAKTCLSVLHTMVGAVPAIGFQIQSLLSAGIMIIDTIEVRIRTSRTSWNLFGSRGLQELRSARAAENGFARRISYMLQSITNVASDPDVSSSVRLRRGLRKIQECVFCSPGCRQLYQIFALTIPIQNARKCTDIP